MQLLPFILLAIAACVMVACSYSSTIEETLGRLRGHHDTMPSPTALLVRPSSLAPAPGPSPAPIVIESHRLLPVRGKNNNQNSNSNSNSNNQNSNSNSNNQQSNQNSNSNNGISSEVQKQLQKQLAKDNEIANDLFASAMKRKGLVHTSTGTQGIRNRQQALRNGRNGVPKGQHQNRHGNGALRTQRNGGPKGQPQHNRQRQGNAGAQAVAKAKADASRKKIKNFRDLQAEIEAYGPKDQWGRLSPGEFKKLQKLFRRQNEQWQGMNDKEKIEKYGQDINDLRGKLGATKDPKQRAVLKEKLKQKTKKWSKARVTEFRNLQADIEAYGPREQYGKLNNEQFRKLQNLIRRQNAKWAGFSQEEKMEKYVQDIDHLQDKLSRIPNTQKYQNQRAQLKQKLNDKKRKRGALKNQQYKAKMMADNAALNDENSDLKIKLNDATETIEKLEKEIGK